MNSILLLSLCTSIALACQATPQAPTTPSTQTAGAMSSILSTDDALRLMEERGRNLSSISMQLKMTEGDPTIGDFTIRTGRVWIQNLPDGASRARVLLDRKQIDDKIFPEKVEYVLDGRNLIDRDYARKVQVTRQVLKPGEKMNLLKLGEGPFPLPIGQSPEEVKRQFEVTVVENHDGAPGSLMVRLIPRTGTSLSRKIKLVEMWISRDDGTPLRIDVLDINGVSLRSNELAEVKFNEPMNDATFKMDEIGGDWRRIDEQFND